MPFWFRYNIFLRQLRTPRNVTRKAFAITLIPITPNSLQSPSHRDARLTLSPRIPYFIRLSEPKNINTQTAFIPRSIWIQSKAKGKYCWTPYQYCHKGLVQWPHHTECEFRQFPGFPPNWVSTEIIEAAYLEVPADDLDCSVHIKNGFTGFLCMICNGHGSVPKTQNPTEMSKTEYENGSKDLIVWNIQHQVQHTLQEIHQRCLLSP